MLGRSLRVLLLRLPELIADYARLPYGLGNLEQRVAAVTEALANGYVRALRDRTLAEQESIRRAELEAQNPELLQMAHNFASTRPDYLRVMQGFVLIYKSLTHQAAVDRFVLH